MDDRPKQNFPSSKSLIDADGVANRWRRAVSRACSAVAECSGSGRRVAQPSCAEAGRGAPSGGPGRRGACLGGQNRGTVSVGLCICARETMRPTPHEFCTSCTVRGRKARRMGGGRKRVHRFHKSRERNSLQLCGHAQRIHLIPKWPNNTRTRLASKHLFRSRNRLYKRRRNAYQEGRPPPTTW